MCAYRPKYDTVTVVPNGNQLQEILDSMGKGEIKAVIDQVRGSMPSCQYWLSSSGCGCSV